MYHLNCIIYKKARKMHLNLLILCVVLSQAIIGTFSCENISDSSGLLVRKKRVINLEPGGDVPVKAGTYPFVVNIELHNKTHCVGSILSSLTIITSVSCASEEVSAYKILSGSIFTYGGTPRYVIDKKLRIGNYVGPRAADGIALFIVGQPFTSRNIGVINLHVEPVLPGLSATVLGWGTYFLPRERGTKHPRVLRSITVRIMSHQDCVKAYRGSYNITDEDVCINDPQKHTGNTDSGAPFIINEKLAGVYLRRGQFPLRRNPEIFAVLQHAHYSQWIMENIVYQRTK